MNGGLPAQGSVPPAPSAEGVPSGVVEGSRYLPGQQLRVLSIDGLNIREAPSTTAPVVGGVVQGDYVAILAGPVETANLVWWQVKAASGVQGWVAGAIGGFDTLSQ